MGRKLGYVLVGAGALALLGGTVAILRSRRQSSLGGLGRASVRGTVKSGGMTLTHHRGDKLPIDERVGILQDITYTSIQDPEIRKLALKITRHCKARDGACETRAIYDWVRKNIRYTGDIGPHKLGRNGPVEGIDLFQTAARTVEFGGGDCDDHSVLVCSLAAHNGMACKYRISSPSRKKAGRDLRGRAKSDDYTHVYPMIGLPKNKPSKWVAADTTLPGDRYGVEAPHGKRLDFAA